MHLKSPVSIPALTVLAALCLNAIAEPQLSSWYTGQSGKYARIFTSKANEAAGITSTTWSRGQGNQNSPTYAGVHEVHHDSGWIYIKTTGLGFHVMGPWYLNEAKTRNFPNFPSNTATTYRIPRTPTAFNGNTTTGFGSIGYFVDGVALFDATDTFSYINSSGSDGSPQGGGRGDGVWNRDAYVNEGVTFDAANAHQAMNLHHYHANAPAIRHLLGDSVDYDAGVNVYTENFNGNHSPILGWVSDGHPIYGPYAYSDPDDPDSPVKRMTSGYQKRDGSNSSTNLNVAGRTTLPQWANRLQGRTTSLASSRYGPGVSNTYTLGHYLEDYAYMGDLGLTHGIDFDLDEFNGRFCVTPEFPDGVWAYFTAIETDGTPLFPYNVGRNFYGTPSGGNTNSIPATATRSFIGGPSKQHSARDTDSRDGVITLTWDTVEGASYQVEQGPDLQNWTEGGEAFTAAAVTQTTSDTPSPASEKTQFYRLRRTGIANYDNSGFDNQFEGAGGNNNGGGGGEDNFVATFAGPPLPPADVIQELRIGNPGIPAALVSVDSRTQLTVSFDAAALPAGNHAVYVIFTTPNGAQLTLISTNRFAP
ncbi:MAG: YHYH protein [Verrucomicrobiaceae bacterium]|nr:YHYH protein [Verrucomicrobiaceae bacterium]